MAFDAKALLPLPQHAVLHEAFIGKNLKDVLMPAAVLDKAVVQRNCLQMLKACEALQVGFRPHVKTHKVYFRTFFAVVQYPFCEGLGLLNPCPLLCKLNPASGFERSSSDSLGKQSRARCRLTSLLSCRIHQVMESGETSSRRQGEDDELMCCFGQFIYPVYASTCFWSSVQFLG